MNKNQLNFENIYKRGQPGCYLSYPHDALVSLFFQNRNWINVNGRALDYGFGSGNNSEFLLAEMAEVHGIEISRSSVEIARKRLTKFGNFRAEHFNMAEEAEDYPASFDLIVAWQMLYYNDEAGIKATLERFIGYLKPGGVLICTLIKPKDVKVKFARPLTANTYLIDGRIPHQEGCEVFAPNSEQELLGLFDRFDVIDYGCFGRLSLMMERTSSEYYIVARERRGKR